MDKTILFIDGENFIGKVEQILKEENIEQNKVDITQIHLKSLIHSVFKDRKVLDMRFYSARLHLYEETRAHSQKLINKQRVLKTNLEKQGFKFILAGNVRGQKVKVDGKTKLLFKEKGVDVRIAVDMVSMSCDKKIDTAIICSSDSDLQPAIAELRSRGITVIYLGFGISPNKGLTYSTNITVLFRNSEIIEAIKKQ